MGIKEKLYNKAIGKANKVELDGETIYLKKTGWLAKDWQKINSPVEKIDKELEPIGDNLKWNWLNLFVGGKKNLVRLILILLLFSMVYYEVTNLLGDAKDWTNGNKYVIVKRQAFDLFCKNTMPVEHIITNMSNYTFDLKGG